MNVGDLIDFLEMCGRMDEIGVEVRFGEAGEAYASKFDVTTFSHTEMDLGMRNE